MTIPHDRSSIVGNKVFEWLAACLWHRLRSGFISSIEDSEVALKKDYTIPIERRSVSNPTQLDPLRGRSVPLA